MKASTKKRPNLDNYDNDEFRLIMERVDISAGELSEIIEERLASEPIGGPYKTWKYEVNELIDRFNNNFGHVYKRVK